MTANLRSPSLSTEHPAPSTQHPALSTQSYCEIAVFGALPGALHYVVPYDLRGKVQPGVRVLAPLGRKQALGLVVALQDIPPDLSRDVVLRPISAVLDDSPVVSRDLMALCRWISDYYFYPLGEALQAALPSEAVGTPQVFYRLSQAGREKYGDSGETSPLLRLLLKEDRVAQEEIVAGSASREKIPRELTRLEKDGWVERTYEWRPSMVSPRKVKSIRLVGSPAELEEAGKNTKVQGLLDVMKQADGWLPIRELRSALSNCDYWVRKLHSSGIIEIADIEELRESQCAQSLEPLPPLSLTEDQERVLESVLPCIEQPRFQPFLLYGVTGSGKTEIYLRLVQEALNRGKGALILVPEIALSTQLEALFRQRFDCRLAVWHSGLSHGTRYDQWRELLAGRRAVILGVRSAVFMPLCNPGLIVVDEEHDLSYKQEDRLRYHARDVALMRARMLDIPILLGSATPSLQSMYHSRMNRYSLLSIPRRVLDRPHPSIQAVDMRRERGSSRILSGALQKALHETVQNGEQALLFLNRRGFATFYLCPKCGLVVQCSHCSVSLTYHHRENTLRCHYCGAEKPVPEYCPSCDHGPLIPHGFGTERVEEEVRRVLPDAKVVRIDRDTVSHPRDMTNFLNTVRQRRADVLIGTQMVAKGHDFPFITLVGIINADTALQISDFRAGESTVQILMQVAGRAGRGDRPGQVILQSYNPHHYTIRSVLDMSYDVFCDEELRSRESLQYPPYTRLLKFLVSAREETTTRDAAHELAAISRETAATLRNEGKHLLVLGPAPAPIMKVQNRFRWHVFIKAWTSGHMQVFTQSVLAEARKSPLLRRVQLFVDRDPASSF